MTDPGQIAEVKQKINDLYDLDPQRRQERSDILSLRVELMKVEELYLIRSRLSDLNHTIEVWGENIAGEIRKIEGGRTY